MVESARVNVGQSQMGEIDLIGTPNGIGGIGCGFGEVEGLAKEGEFETVAMAGGIVKIAGVVPPFGLVIGVVEVIGGELIVIAGKRREVDGEEERIKLHGSPLLDSCAGRCGRDRARPGRWRGKRR